MAAARRRQYPSDRLEPLEERLDRERSPEREGSSPDLFDVPAAVICMRCGEPDCSGCESDDQSRSGVIAIVAWERPTTPVLPRLWTTARQTTRDAEGFFELLPDGPVMPALRFAATCELLATTAFFVVLLAAAAVVAPGWLKEVALDPRARSLALRGIVIGLPAFAGLLVAAHAAHGLAIDLGARMSGVRGARSRALRFGLYACGWDLVMGPLGAIVVAFKEGPKAAFALGSALAGLPTRATIAFLRGAYRLEGEQTRSALRASYVGASIATMAFAALVIAAIVAAIF